MSPAPYAFRILGATCEPRRLVLAADAFAGYATVDERAEVGKESYLSAFQFGEDFRQQLVETGSTKGFCGPCWSNSIWFDIDAGDLERARRDASRLALKLDELYLRDNNALLIFFSGSKGFHVGLPTAVWSPEPSIDFNKAARKFAENVAERAEVGIDIGVYDKARAFRAPNSRHPKTGYHKRQFSLDELTGLTVERIIDLSRSPAPFDLPETTGTSAQAAADWQAALAKVASETDAKKARQANNSTPSLNRLTFDFIRSGAHQGDRHRLLFSAAANLAEFGCPPALATALLTESALDSGLPPTEVRRQIECGLGAATPVTPASGRADSAAVNATTPPTQAEGSASTKAEDAAADRQKQIEWAPNNAQALQGR